MVFNIDGRLCDCYLRSLALTKSQFYFRVLETIVKFGGIIIGVSYGLYGIALAVVFSNSIMVIIKLSYIAKHIQIKWSIIGSTILKAWKPFLYLTPILCFISLLFNQHSLFYNIIELVSFILLCLSLFLLTPNLISHEYKVEVHSKISTFINKKIHSLWRRF